MLFPQPEVPRIHDAIDEQDSLISDGFEEVFRRHRQYEEKPTNLGHFSTDLYAWDSDIITNWTRDPNGASLTLDRRPNSSRSSRQTASENAMHMHSPG